MKKKIITLYVYDNHASLMNDYQHYLAQNGVCVDVFNVVNWSFTGTVNRPPFLYRLLLPLRRCRRFKIGTLIYKLFGGVVLRQLTLQYDIVDAHTFSKTNLNLVDFWKNKGLLVKFTPWGSDLLRADEAKLTYIRGMINKIDMITLAAPMFDFFVTIFPDYIHPVLKANFGKKIFEKIDVLSQKELDELKNKWYGAEVAKRLFITIGYNGSRAQNHIEIIESLRVLDVSAYHVIVPFTYGGSQEYFHEISSALSSLGCSFDIVSKYLSVDLLIELRQISDIVINIQTTDAFSGSIQEHVFTQNVCILGEWLPYVGIFHDSDIFVVSTSKASLSVNLKKVVDNYLMYREKTQGNRTKLGEMNAWKNAIRSWRDALLSIE